MTVVGTFPHADRGQLLRFAGHWDVHAKHGTQLKAIAFEEVVPQSPDAIAAYLSSVIPGKKTCVFLKLHCTPHDSCLCESLCAMLNRA